MQTYRRMLRAKIPRAVVTEADLNYEGSLTIPPELMALADIKPYEAVHVWNVTRGTRFETYAITGVEQSGTICVNGAAAHLAKPGDLIIIACFTSVPEPMVNDIRPIVVFVDDRNRPVKTAVEVPGPHTRGDDC